MEEQLISFETAKLAKKKGFNIGINRCYDPKDKDIKIYDDWCEERLKSVDPRVKRLIEAPTQSLLQKWLRDVHKIKVILYYHNYHNHGGENGFMWNMIVLNKYDTMIASNYYDKYEEALEIGLQEALRLIKTEQSIKNGD